MNKIILSICIPTYNRSEYLKRCLESLSIQVENNRPLNESIQIVVSDNHSTDNTSDIAEGYKKLFKNFKYLRTEKNLGFDLNVFNVVSNADGEYCWYLGDDDIIINGGIEFVVNILKTNNHDFIGVNSEHLKENVSYTNIKKFNISRSIALEDFNEFYFQGYCQGGVSVLIFNRNIWMDCVDQSNFLEHWLYYETVLKILVKTTKQMIFLSETFVLTGQDSRWAENGTEIFTFGNSNILLEKMITFGFDKNRVIHELNKNSSKLLIMLLRSKGHGLKCNFSNFKYILKTFKYTSRLQLMISLLFVYPIPNVIIRFIRDNKKILIKI